jgi:hypothetical protein
MLLIVFMATIHPLVDTSESVKPGAAWSPIKNDPEKMP